MSTKNKKTFTVPSYNPKTDLYYCNHCQQSMYWWNPGVVLTCTHCGHSCDARLLNIEHDRMSRLAWIAGQLAVVFEQQVAEAEAVMFDQYSQMCVSVRRNWFAGLVAAMIGGIVR